MVRKEKKGNGKNIAHKGFLCYIVGKELSLYTFYRKGTKYVRKRKEERNKRICFQSIPA